MKEEPKEFEEIELIKYSVKLHNWYLEAVCNLDDEHFNKKAQKSFEELSAEQQGIDRYIAKKVLRELKETDQRARLDCARIAKENFKASDVQFMEHPGKRFFCYKLDIEDEIRASIKENKCKDQ